MQGEAGMHYYFHIRAESASILDDEGLDLPNISAARIEMRASAEDLIRAALHAGPRFDVRAIDLEDESGSIIETFWVRNIFH